MNSFMTNRIEEFKKRINFQEISKLQSQTEGIVIKWDFPLQWQPFSNQNWEIVNNSNSLSIDKDFVLKEWVLRQGEKTLVVEVGVSSAGTELAQQHLLNVAVNTTMMEIPYRKGPIELGDISIINTGEMIRNVVWVFKNVCFRISDLDNSIDVLAFARWLQLLAKQHIVKNISDYKPKIENIKASAQRIQVDETLTIEVNFSAEVNPENMYIEMEQDNYAADLIAEEGTMMTFLGEQPGISIIHIMVVDKVTLLSYSAKVQVVVEAKSKH
jgi:hypothetical protein